MYSANAHSSIVGLTRCQNLVNTCPSDASEMDGHMQWEQGDEETVRTERGFCGKKKIGQKEIEEWNR